MKYHYRIKQKDTGWGNFYYAEARNQDPKFDRGWFLINGSQNPTFDETMNAVKIWQEIDKNVELNRDETDNIVWESQ